MCVHVCVCLGVCLCLGVCVWYKHFSVFLLQMQAVYTLEWVCLCLCVCVVCCVCVDKLIAEFMKIFAFWKGKLLLVRERKGGGVSEQKTLAPNRMCVCMCVCVGMCETPPAATKRMCILSACGLSCRDTDADSDAGVDVSLPTPPPICCLTSLNYWGSFGVTTHSLLMKVFGGPGGPPFPFWPFCHFPLFPFPVLFVTSRVQLVVDCVLSGKLKYFLNKINALWYS